MSSLERYLARKLQKPTPGFPVVDGKVMLKDTTTGEVFDIPAIEFIPAVQQVKNERIMRTNNPELGDPDRWDDEDLDRLTYLCGPKYSHLSRMKRYHAAQNLVRKRGLLVKVNGLYRYTIMRSSAPISAPALR